MPMERKPILPAGGSSKGRSDGFLSAGRFLSDMTGIGKIFSDVLNLPALSCGFVGFLL